MSGHFLLQCVHFTQSGTPSVREDLHVKGTRT